MSLSSILITSVSSYFFKKSKSYPPKLEFDVFKALTKYQLESKSLNCSD